MRCADLIRVVIAAGLLSGLSGCALIQKPLRWAKITPVVSHQTLTAADGYYEAGKAAIERRDYAAALDLLQKARAAQADDVRVLNAFGVVYDKLGRFDLSTRYYAQAAAVDPDSSMVSHNIAYSRLLQTRTLDNSQVTIAEAAGPASPGPNLARTEAPMARAAAPQPVTVPRLVAAGPHVLRLELPAGLADPSPQALNLDQVLLAAQPQTLPIKTGYPLMVINASGAKNGADTVRLALAEHGWSARQAASETRAMQAQTTIRYSPPQASVAKALARTLPVPAVLELCADNCAGVQLVVGADMVKGAGARPSDARTRRG